MKTDITHMRTREIKRIAKYAAIHGLTAAASHFSRNWATCRRACRLTGTDWHKPRPGTPPAVKARAVEMRRKGALLREIAAKFNVTSAYVSNWCRDAKNAEAAK